jgi:hypothetical protein
MVQLVSTKAQTWSKVCVREKGQGSICGELKMAAATHTGAANQVDTRARRRMGRRPWRVIRPGPGRHCNIDACAAVGSRRNNPPDGTTKQIFTSAPVHCTCRVDGGSPACPHRAFPVSGFQVSGNALPLPLCSVCSGNLQSSCLLVECHGLPRGPFGSEHLLFALSQVCECDRGRSCHTLFLFAHHVSGLTDSVDADSL